MRTIILSTALTALLILPGAALGVEFVSVAGSADCNGWTGNLEIWFRDGAQNVELSYVVVLRDASGTEVQRFEAVESLAVVVGPPVPFTYGGAFANPPAEGSSVSAEFHLFDYFTDGYNEKVAGFLAVPSCVPPVDDTEPAVCTHTAAWWRRHQAQWPVDELVVGDETWDMRTLHQVLNRPTWGNLRLLLARQLIAAKFNALVSPQVADVTAIAAADAFLSEYDPFSRGRGRARAMHWRQEARMVRELMAPLVIFNRLGCVEDATAALATDDVTDLELVDKALAGESIVPEEDVSLSTVKARYR